MAKLIRTKIKSSKPITIAKVVTKTYTLSDKTGTKHLSYYTDTGIIKQLNFMTSTDCPVGAARVYAVDFAGIQSLRTMFRELAPVDMRILIDSTEITDAGIKMNLINNLIISEYINSNHSYLIPLTTSDSVKRVKKEQEVKGQMAAWIRKLTATLPDLSLSECKKIQNMIK